MSVPAPFSHPMLPHFYRAVVAHMDVWRQRMDATTNWAAATTAGMVTFSFGTVGSPHFVLLLALAFDLMFLVMESRRYQVFDLWRRRFRLLNQFVIGPIISPGSGPPAADAEAALDRVAADLGRTVPHISLLDAIGYRIRRNHGYIITITLLAWMLKLEVHPEGAVGIGEAVDRAQIGTMPGDIVVGAVAAVIALLFVLAARAPSEQMLNWTPVSAPLSRWVRTRVRRGDAPGGDGGSQQP